MNKHKTSNENDNCIEILMELYFEKEKKSKKDNYISDFKTFL